MRRLAYVLLAQAGCGFNVPPLTGDASGDAGGDATDIDTMVDPTCAQTWTFAASNHEPCTQGPPHPSLVLDAGTYRFNSMTGSLVKDGNPYMTLATTGTDPRVLSLAGLTIESGAIVAITGDVPVIISVHGVATITGRIGVSGTGLSSGPGGESCAGAKGNDTAPPPTPVWGAGGGGGGGAFGSAGAAGGAGDCDDNSPQTPGGPTMVAVGEVLLVPLRGGCRGGAGGEEDPQALSGGTPGAGGGGGGALQITAREMLILEATARVSANGGGGVRGVNAQYTSGSHVGVGGGGGGSGGGILLESALVTLDAQSILCANGGGGGGGTHNNDGGITNGADGACAAMAAPGGNGSDASGGAGAYLGVAAIVGEFGTRTDDGGGGGGGGVGRIRVRSINAMPTGFLSTPAAHVD